MLGLFDYQNPPDMLRVKVTLKAKFERIKKEMGADGAVLYKIDVTAAPEEGMANEASVLLFAKDSHVSFTNNRAEQDLRMAKVKQKVSGCFHSEFYAHAYCRISSYLQTMASKGINLLIAIQIALAGESL